MNIKSMRLRDICIYEKMHMCKSAFDVNVIIVFFK